MGVGVVVCGWWGGQGVGAGVVWGEGYDCEEDDDDGGGGGGKEGMIVELLLQHHDCTDGEKRRCLCGADSFVINTS